MAVDSDQRFAEWLHSNQYGWLSHFFSDITVQQALSVSENELLKSVPPASAGNVKEAVTKLREALESVQEDLTIDHASSGGSSALELLEQDLTTDHGSDAAIAPAEASGLFVQWLQENGYGGLREDNAENFNVMTFSRWLHKSHFPGLCHNVKPEVNIEQAATDEYFLSTFPPGTQSQVGDAIAQLKDQIKAVYDNVNQWKTSCEQDKHVSPLELTSRRLGIGKEALNVIVQPKEVKLPSSPLPGRLREALNAVRLEKGAKTSPESVVALLHRRLYPVTFSVFAVSFLVSWLIFGALPDIPPDFRIPFTFLLIAAPWQDADRAPAAVPWILCVLYKIFHHYGELTAFVVCLAVEVCLVQLFNKEAIDVEKREHELRMEKTKLSERKTRLEANLKRERYVVCGWKSSDAEMQGRLRGGEQGARKRSAQHHLAGHKILCRPQHCFQDHQARWFYLRPDHRLSCFSPHQCVEVIWGCCCGMDLQGHPDDRRPHHFAFYHARISVLAERVDLGHSTQSVPTAVFLSTQHHTDQQAMAGDPFSCLGPDRRRVAGLHADKFRIPAPGLENGRRLGGARHA